MSDSALAMILLALTSCGQVEEVAGGGKAGPANSIVGAARSQIGVTVSYDPAYVALSYPGGDLPREKGVCSDVVIRALREGKKMDLQKLVHEDMKANFASAFSKDQIYKNKYHIQEVFISYYYSSSSINFKTVLDCIIFSLKVMFKLEK